MPLRRVALATLLLICLPAHAEHRNLRAYGIAIGVLQPGHWNAITDVPGVEVGQKTLVEGGDVRTGVTVVLPHAGNIFQNKVPAAVYVGNGFGKLTGTTQIAELGNIETPIVLTNTLSVPTAADALIDYTLSFPANADVLSVNPVVGETNDGYVLNAIRSRPITREQVRRALTQIGRNVEEGSVGAGAGTVAFGWKGGIGTSSRLTGTSDSGWTVGVLVQSNFGGDLHILGVPVGRELKRRGVLERGEPKGARGSIMIVVATDAPLSDRNLRRLAARALIGVGRTGSAMDNGSGDYVIAFSTNAGGRRRAGEARRNSPELANDSMSQLFEAAVEATEEAIYNSLFMAKTVRSDRGTVQALPVGEVLQLLRSHGVLSVRGKAADKGQ